MKRQLFSVAFLFVVTVLSSACSISGHRPSTGVHSPQDQKNVTNGPSQQQAEADSKGVGQVQQSRTDDTGLEGVTDKGYDEFQAVNRALPDGFQPKGFELYNYHSGNAVYYGFDAELAWGKRKKTVVDGDDAKPSQTEYIYIQSKTRIANVIEMMYVPQVLEPDVVGFLSIPTQESQLQDGTNLRLDPPQSFMQVFSYRHLVVVIKSFGTSSVTPMEIVQSNKAISLELRSFFGQNH